MQTQKLVLETLRQNKLPILKSDIVKDKEEMLKIFGKLRKPVVLKIVSSDIIHKTDSGCVKLDIMTEEEGSEAYDEIMKKAGKSKVEGVMIQEMIKGKEVIIGVKKDPQFGHVIAFGLGGIYVELLKDVSLRVLPINKSEAEEMIEELKGKQLLEGFRGEKPVNKKELIEILLKTSSMIAKNPEINEMDLNPVIVDHKRALIVDARILAE